MRIICDHEGHPLVLIQEDGRVVVHEAVVVMDSHAGPLLRLAVPIKLEDMPHLFHLLPRPDGEQDV